MRATASVISFHCDSWLLHLFRHGRHSTLDLRKIVGIRPLIVKVSDPLVEWHVGAGEARSNIAPTRILRIWQDPFKATQDHHQPMPKAMCCVCED